MASTRRINLPWSTRFSSPSTGDGVFSPQTPWSPGVDLGRVRVFLEENSELSTNLVVRPGYQTANVESSPDCVVALDAHAQTSCGVEFGSAMNHTFSPLERA